MAMATTVGGLPEAEHSAQLRKAVIASTVGTAIEWYDFFLYGTAAGLVFGKLFFPNQDRAVGDASRLRNLFHWLCRSPGRRCDLRPLRRPHWPQGDPDRHAAVHGACNLRHRLCADLQFDRYLGRGDLDRPAGASGHWRRRRVGRLHSVVDGVVAHAQSARAGRRMAAIRRPLRTAALDNRGHCLQLMVGQRLPGLGLAHSVRAFDRPGRESVCGFALAFSRRRYSRSSWIPTRSRRRRF